MKKEILLISFLLILCAVIVYLVEYKMPYKKSETISFSDFLNFTRPTKENCASIKLNKRGDVVFDNKVIILNDKTPLNKKTPKGKYEIKTYLIASGREKLDCREKSFKNDFYYSELRKKYSGRYKPSETMTFDEYLNEDTTPKSRKELKLNKNGDVIFKNKVVMTEAGVPLNKKTAYKHLEILVYIEAAKIEPMEGCDPNNTEYVGRFGCYFDEHFELFTNKEE